MDTLSSGRLDQRGKDAVGFESGFRSRSKRYLAKDHQMPEGLFCVVIGGRYTRASEEGEEESLFGTHEIAPKGLGRFEAKRVFAEAAQLRKEVFFDLGGPMPGDITGFKLPPRVAESGAEIDETVAEGADSGVFFGLRQEGMLRADLLGVGDEVGEADLPVCSNSVIGGIAVTHQGSAKVLSEDGFSYLRGPMSVDMEEGEMLMACEPDVMPYAVTAPGSLVAMDNVGGPDLVPQVLIERFPPP